MTFLYFYIFYWILATIGATYGLHRYWAHRKSSRNIWFEWISLICALMIGVYKPISWIGIHRLHHKYSDTAKDPHSPKYQGFWKVFLSRWEGHIPYHLVKDCVRNPRMRFFQRYGKYLIWPVIIFSPYTIILGYIGIGILNTAGHSNGPANHWWINILAPFEGNHKDHHAGL